MECWHDNYTASQMDTSPMMHSRRSTHSWKTFIVPRVNRVILKRAHVCGRTFTRPQKKSRRLNTTLNKNVRTHKHQCTSGFVHWLSVATHFSVFTAWIYFAQRIAYAQLEMDKVFHMASNMVSLWLRSIWVALWSLNTHYVHWTMFRSTMQCCFLFSLLRDKPKMWQNKTPNNEHVQKQKAAYVLFSRFVCGCCRRSLCFCVCGRLYPCVPPTTGGWCSVGASDKGLKTFIAAVDTVL